MANVEYNISEKEIQAAIFEWLIYHNHLAIRINSGAMVVDQEQAHGQVRRFIRFATWQILGHAATWAGVSDILACCFGRFVAIECKAPGEKGKVSDNQRAFLDAVARCGGLAIVADSIEDVEKVGELVY